jgi:hypothetical protein
VGGALFCFFVYGIFFYPIDSNLIQQEKSIYDYCIFILAEDNDPITKYIYIKYTKPIEGIVTEEQLTQYVTEWKPKSEASAANIQMQKDETLTGLPKEEQWCVVFYANESIDGKTPDPNQAATYATSGTIADAEKKAVIWMKDSRILKAINKYQSITMKYNGKE